MVGVSGVCRKTGGVVYGSALCAPVPYTYRICDQIYELECLLAVFGLGFSGGLEVKL